MAGRGQFKRARIVPMDTRMLVWRIFVHLAVAPHVRRVVVGMDRQMYDNANTLTSDSFMAAGDESVSFLSSAIIILCCHPPQARRAGQ